MLFPVSFSHQSEWSNQLLFRVRLICVSLEFAERSAARRTIHFTGHATCNRYSCDSSWLCNCNHLFHMGWISVCHKLWYPAQYHNSNGTDILDEGNKLTVLSSHSPFHQLL